MAQSNKTSVALRELIGFIIFSVSVFLFIALCSYDAMDPSFNTEVVGQNPFVRNLAGVVGSYCADLLMQVFGLASFGVVVFAVVLSFVFVLGKSERKNGVTFLGVGLFIFCISLLFSLLDAQNHYPASWGGAVGFYAKQFFKKYFGTFGSFLFTFCGLVVAGALTLQYSIGRGFEKIAGVNYKKWLPLGMLGALPSFATAQFQRWMKPQKNKSLKKEMQLDLKEPAKEKAPEHKAPALKLVKNETPAGKSTSNDHSGFEKNEEVHKSIPIVVKSDASKLKSTEKAKAPQWNIKTDYKLPDIALLEAPADQTIKVDRDELLDNAQKLENKMKDFGILGKVVEVQPGPVVTMYEFEPAPGVKVNQITRLGDDLAMALRAISVRIALLPGKSVIGIEVANKDRQTVYLKDIISDAGFIEHPSLLTFALGKDISGIPSVTDLRKMPHLLIAGATGAGKSVAVNSMILSILYRATPEQVRMILVDPKMLELSLYDDIPHLLLPVVTDPRKASAALRWAVTEMERRYRLMADLGVRNIEGYNKKVESEEFKKKKEPTPTEAFEAATVSDGKVEMNEHEGAMPFIMIVIDELADLMMVSGREVEDSIIRLAQMARASGIHLMLATQRPSVDVITGVIKANMPARISFQVSSKIDSRTILDANGAESLLGYGDMLFLPPGTSKLIRIHGAYVTDQEVERVTNFWKEQAKPQYNEDILKGDEEGQEEGGFSEDDPDYELYKQALEVARNQGSASISMIQRRLRIGYNRAARLVERMEEEGLLAPGEVGKPREVLPSRLT